MRVPAKKVNALLRSRQRSTAPVSSALAIATLSNHKPSDIGMEREIHSRIDSGRRTSRKASGITKKTAAIALSTGGLVGG
jgi:hypothetical protein